MSSPAAVAPVSPAWLPTGLRHASAAASCDWFASTFRSDPDGWHLDDVLLTFERAGESHLAQWWWESRVRAGSNAAFRARAIEELVTKQAERVQHAVLESAFEPVLLSAFAELVRDGTTGGSCA